MKRPKLPKLRIAKKYRDGKLFGTAIAAFEEKYKAAIKLDDPALRFDALAKLEKKIDAQYRQGCKAIYGMLNKQTNLGVFGSGITGIALISTSVAVALPLAPFFLLGGAVVGFGGMFGSMIAKDVSYTRGRKSKDEKNPIAALKKIEDLLAQTQKDLIATAKEHPLSLLGKPRFQELSAAKPEIAAALTQAFMKAQLPKVTPPTTDLAAALGKPRLPKPRK